MCSKAFGTDTTRFGLESYINDNNCLFNVYSAPFIMDMQCSVLCRKMVQYMQQNESFLYHKQTFREIIKTRYSLVTDLHFQVSSLDIWLGPLSDSALS